MAAGLGFKDFQTGEVLTAADVDGYLMQGIWVFADATARDAAVTSPQEGNFAFLKDTNVTTYYTGSAWTNLDTTGMVNPMTTTGDTIYSSSGSTPARLGIGTAGQVLQVNSGATAPEWATPAASSGLTFITSSTFSNVASATIDGCFTSTYNAYLIVIEQLGAVSGSDDIQFQLRYTGPTTQTSGYYGASGGGVYNSATFNNIQNNNTNQFTIGTDTGQSSNQASGGYMIISKVGVLGLPVFNGAYADITGTIQRNFGGAIDANQTWTGILFKSSSTNIYGIIRVYGLAKS
jgi:hypothetical protein